MMIRRSIYFAQEVVGVNKFFFLNIEVLMPKKNPLHNIKFLAEYVVSQEKRIDALANKVEKFTSTNSDYTKCAEEIMANISSRRGYDLYSCDKDIIDDIRKSIADIISAHFA